MRLNKEGMKRMKKFFPAFMAFLLMFSTVGPLHSLAAAFPALLKGSEVGDDHKGTVTVIPTVDNYNYVLHDENKIGEIVGTPAIITSLEKNKDGVFNNVPPGSYYVTASKEMEEPIDSKIKVKVKPKVPVLLHNSNNIRELTFDISKVPYTDPNTIVKLYYNDKIVDEKKFGEVIGSNIIFKNLNASKNYQVSIVVNTAESEKSVIDAKNPVVVSPDAVTIKVDENFGESDLGGIINVSNSRDGNTLKLYKKEGIYLKEFDTKVKGETAKIKNLPPGEYYVTQVENGIESSPSNKESVLNKKTPVIILEGKNPLYIEHKPSANVKYVEEGYKVNNKNGTESTNIHKSSITCSPGPGIESTSVEMVIPPELSGDSIAIGKYTIEYIATDCEDKELKSSKKREVTVRPEKLNFIKEKHTYDTHENTGTTIDHHTTGELIVETNYSNTEIKLYKDTNSKPIPINVVADEKKRIIRNVEVGKNYFITQIVDNVESEKIGPFEINDTTPPQIKLLGEKDISLEMNELFIEPNPSYEVIDNIDSINSLKSNIEIKVNGNKISGDKVTPDKIDSKKPGIYLITYHLEDSAGNTSVPQTRTVKVKPLPVIVTGSTAAVGTIDVTNIYPGTLKPFSPTTLTLFKYNDNNTNSYVYDKISLTAEERTHTFINLEPGRYYVIQTVSEQDSRQSNVVEIVDIDKPYIMINGPEEIKLTLDSEFTPYFTSSNIFKDPGAIADDYLLSKDKTLALTATVTGPNSFPKKEENDGVSIEFPQFTISEPGIYQIKYTAKAKRGAQAQSKYRTITVAPPQTTKIKHEGKGVITSFVNSYSKSTTTAKLYNSYNQLVATDNEILNAKATFKNVPNGIGYYVTQTVNGIESQPSLPVNVSIFETPLSITSFKFKEVDSFSVINHKDNTILVTVPKGTVTSKLTPITNVIGTISSNCKGAQDFSSKNPVDCTVESDPVQNPKKTKVYKVTVKEAAGVNEIPTPNTKEISISDTNSSHSLTSKEKREASENGINFLMNDKKNSIYVPASNVIEAENPMLTVSGTTTDKLTVKWGNLSRFMQPLEMKLEIPSNNSLNKSFAKIVDGYEIMLPSTSNTTAKTVTGLVNEPGTYALVSNINTPVFKDNKFSVATGTVYYTTSSKDITFISSARDKTDSINKRYVTTASPTEILKWTKYKEGDIIPSTVTELYAVSVNGNKISEIYSHKSPSSIDWSKNVPTYETHKVLAINFNARVDREALYSELIFVTDDATNKTVPTNLEMSNDGKTIYVVPQQAYTRGKQYTLHIERQFKGNTKNKEFLKKSLLQTFKIE